MRSSRQQGSSGRHSSHRLVQLGQAGPTGGRRRCRATPRDSAATCGQDRAGTQRRRTGSPSARVWDSALSDLTSLSQGRSGRAAACRKAGEHVELEHSPAIAGQAGGAQDPEGSLGPPRWDDPCDVAHEVTAVSETRLPIPWWRTAPACVRGISLLVNPVHPWAGHMKRSHRCGCRGAVINGPRIFPTGRRRRCSTSPVSESPTGQKGGECIRTAFVVEAAPGRENAITEVSSPLPRWRPMSRGLGMRLIRAFERLGVVAVRTEAADVQPPLRAVTNSGRAGHPGAASS